MSELIFDVGMWNGEDTEYYLARGFKVVAIDADPKVIEKAKIRFKTALKSKKLVLLNYVINDKDDQEVDFHISNIPGGSSLKYAISNKKASYSHTLKVKTKRLSSLIEEYGVPFYCKIDIEGSDSIALKTLSNLRILPKFISVETECLEKDEIMTREHSLVNLRNLYRLGYSGFKLIDQHNLIELKPEMFSFIKRTFIDRLKGVLRMYNILKLPPIKKILPGEFEYDFPYSASGPFGEDLAGDWLDYKKAENNFLLYRSLYFNLPINMNYIFWCDWHAKL